MKIQKDFIRVGMGILVNDLYSTDVDSGAVCPTKISSSSGFNKIRKLADVLEIEPVEILDAIMQPAANRLLSELTPADTFDRALCDICNFINAVNRDFNTHYVFDGVFASAYDGKISAKIVNNAKALAKAQPQPKHFPFPAPEGFNSWAAYARHNYPDKDWTGRSAPRELERMMDAVYLAAKSIHENGERAKSKYSKHEDWDTLEIEEKMQ